jgi:hypothetical protein
MGAPLWAQRRRVGDAVKIIRVGDAVQIMNVRGHFPRQSRRRE